MASYLADMGPFNSSMMLFSQGFVNNTVIFSLYHKTKLPMDMGFTSQWLETVMN